MVTEKAKTKKEPKVAKETKPEVKKVEVVAAKPTPVQDSGVAKEVKKPSVILNTRPVEDELDDISPADFPTEKELASKPDRYFEAVGRRKTAVARVRLFTRGDKQFMINGKNYQEYFSLKGDQETSTASMRKMKCLDKFKVTVIVKGGGRNAQAEAVRHGTARVLVDFNNNFRKRLRKAGFLTRDPRMRERKKFGLKRARKSPQWAKR